MGMFYCMLGTLIQKIPQTKTVFICTISAFILYVVGVYFQYESGLRHLREIKITINRRNAGFFMSNFIYFYVVRSCILSLYVI